MGGVVFPIFAQPPVISLVNEIPLMKQLDVKRSRLFLVIVDDIADDRRSLDVRHRRPPLHLVALRRLPASRTPYLAGASGPCSKIDGVSTLECDLPHTVQTITPPGRNRPPERLAVGGPTLRPQRQERHCALGT